MTLFSVGPVQMYPETLELLGRQNPYFRTPEFSEEVLAIKDAYLTCVHAPAGAEFALLTASGTGAMDAAVTNLLAPDDGALVVNAGSFGNRFAQLCRRAGAQVTEITLPFLEGDLTREMLEAAYERHAASFGGQRPCALFIQGCETSSGRKFDLKLAGEFCRERGLLYVVDAVSAFLCDPIDMQADGIDIVLTASQKALALSPGLSLLSASPRAAQVIARNHVNAALYLDLQDCFLNMQRGQTPYTCAVSEILALRPRICGIAERGVDTEIQLHASRAIYFRALLQDMPQFNLPAIPLSNACTPLVFEHGGAQALYQRLRRDYDLTLCPSGGDHADTLLRVGHMGNLHAFDYDALASAMREVLA